MFEEKDDTIIARWLADELNEAERAEFEASSEYAEYIRLTNALTAFEKPAFDKEALRSKLWNAIDAQQQPEKKVINLKPLYYISGIAASIVLIIGLFFNTVTYSTDFGEQQTVSLPDGTQVELNAKSTLAHNRFFWSNNKVVSLSGEGFFNVTKGDSFKVKTDAGTVSVLGTEFNINTRANAFQLHLYEGKVLFETAAQDQEEYLMPGDAVSVEGDILVAYKHQDTAPLWQTGQSSFKNTPLLTVIAGLTAQYDVVFTYDDALIKGHFTGTFVHDNLELALKSVFVPMGITYEIASDQKTVTLTAR